MSNDIRCIQRGRAQQTLPAGAGTARFVGFGRGNGTGAVTGAEIGHGSAARARQVPPDPELRWVGAQHRMYGYCGRAIENAAAEVNVAATNATAAAGGARAYPARPVALLEARRHLVVRIGPRAAGAPGAVLVSPTSGEGNGQTQARAL